MSRISIKNGRFGAGFEDDGDSDEDDKFLPTSIKGRSGKDEEEDEDLELGIYDYPYDSIHYPPFSVLSCSCFSSITNNNNNYYANDTFAID